MDTITAAASGLLTTTGTAVPLVGVSAHVDIRDYGCRVVTTQRYRNDEAQPIEAVYRFPLDERAAVAGFEVEVDGRRIQGKVEDREQAFKRYDEAIEAGHGGYLLDEERADVFTVSVGNLPPGKDAVLRLTTVSDLPLEGDAIRFTLPTTVAPRYAPAEDRRGVGETEAGRVSAPYAADVPYGLTFEADIRMTAPIRSVESPSHPIAVTVERDHAAVRLSARDAALDRDVILTITLAESHEPRAVLERAPDGHTYALVSFRPQLDLKPGPAELIFLVDRSGSMSGQSIVEARNALQLALRSLTSGCVFNIVGFGSRYEALFPESRAYDEQSLAEAVEHVRTLHANLGGTEILPALAHVLEAGRREGLARQVFVLTDGEISNTDAVIALARSHAGHTRVFTFGIGAGASHHLVRGLARAGEGAAEFIAPGERVEARVLRQVSRALLPALSEVQVDWSAVGPDVTQAPFEVPPVFADGRVLVAGRLPSTWAPGAAVALRASGPVGAIAVSAPVDPATVQDGTLAGTLWARQMIRDLEEGRSARHGRRGSRQARARALHDDEARAAIVEIGTAWNLVSRHTSFVAVETREHPTEGEVVLRRVPLLVTRGWHGIESRPGRVAGTIGGSVTDTGVFRVQSARWGDAELSTIMSLGLSEADAMSDGVSESRPPRPIRRRARAGVPGAPSATAPGAVRPVDRLVLLQAADGSWLLDDDLSKVLGWATARQAKKAFGRTLADDLDRRAAGTALALAWLEREAQDTRDEWRLLAEKARQWLAPLPDDWLTPAAEALGRR